MARDSPAISFSFASGCESLVAAASAHGLNHFSAPGKVQLSNREADLLNGYRDISAMSVFDASLSCLTRLFRGSDATGS